MKRWLAALLAVALLFSGGTVLAENANSRDIVDIQESMSSREGETVGTLAENILFLMEALQKEEIRSLLKMEDVQDILSEVVYRVLAWLVENRPVTMKILAELGVVESDLRCIEKLWDSADRISAATEAYMETEDGKQLSAEIKAVQQDQELRETLVRFAELLSSEDLLSMLSTISDAVDQVADAERASAGSLTEIALSRQLDPTSFIGNLVIDLLIVLERSKWARESLPALLNSETLWPLLNHLADNTQLDAIYQEELTLLMRDPDINDFLQRTLTELAVLMHSLQESPVPSETTDKEETP